MEDEFAYKIPNISLKRLIEHDNSDKFTIVIKIVSKDSKSYSNQKENTKKIEINTTTNQDRVISKKINDIYLIDPTFDKYEMNFTSISSISTDYSEKIANLLHKLFNSILEEVVISEEERQDFFHLLFLLNDQDNETKKEYFPNISSISDAISLLSTEFHENSILYLSSKFKEFMTKNSFENIDCEIVNEVIDLYFEDSSQNHNENEFEEIFEEMEKKEEDYRIVMHFLIKIEPDKMSKNMIEYFYAHLDDEIINNDFAQIISIIRQHLLSIELYESKKKLTKNEIETKDIKKVEFEGNELQGIIEYIKKIDGENIDHTGTLKLSGGGFNNVNYPPKNLIKYDIGCVNHYYYNFNCGTPSEDDGWIEFDFCKRKVNLTSYTIRSSVNSYPKSWRIVGSNDKINWILIDQQTENAELNSRCKSHRFECTEPNSDYYRYIRYIQKDNWNNDNSRKYYIYLTCIELFGSIAL